MSKLIIMIICLALCGCASDPRKIASVSVSTYQYKDYSCDMIFAETERISRRLQVLYNSLKKEANADTAQMAVGLLILWPTLFFLEGGDGPEAAEFARLKGEYEALEKVAIRKGCEVYSVE